MTTTTTTTTPRPIPLPITTFPAAVEEILNNTTIETGCTFDTVRSVVAQVDDHLVHLTDPANAPFDTVRSVVAQVDDHLVHLTDPANANEDYVQEYYGQFNPFSTLQFAHRITTRTSCFKSAISSCTTDLAILGPLLRIFGLIMIAFHTDRTSRMAEQQDIRANILQTSNNTQDSLRETILESAAGINANINSIKDAIDASNADLHASIATLRAQISDMAIDIRDRFRFNEEERFLDRVDLTNTVTSLLGLFRRGLAHFGVAFLVK